MSVKTCVLRPSTSLHLLHSKHRGRGREETRSALLCPKTQSDIIIIQRNKNGCRPLQVMTTVIMQMGRWRWRCIREHLSILVRVKLHFCKLYSRKFYSRNLSSATWAPQVVYLKLCSSCTSQVVLLKLHACEIPLPLIALVDYIYYSLTVTRHLLNIFFRELWILQSHEELARRSQTEFPHFKTSMQGSRQFSLELKLLLLRAIVSSVTS